MNTRPTPPVEPTPSEWNDQPDAEREDTDWASEQARAHDGWAVTAEFARLETSS